MNKKTLIWRLLCGRPVQHSLVILVTALTISLTVCALQLSNGITGALNTATRPFPLLAGAKGSPEQLVLSTVFLRSIPPANVGWATVEKLRGDRGVTAAIPIGLGDNYRGFRVVGTEPALFNYTIPGDKKPWLQLTSGKPFDAPLKAVIGTTTAQLTGLKVGDTFRTIHGTSALANSREHGDPITVTGILAPLGGPWDKAILVHISTLWSQHADHNPGPVAAAAAEAHDEEDHDHEEKGDVTAVLVRPAGYSDALRLLSDYRSDRDAQIIFPAQTIIQLLSLLGDAEKILRFLALAAVGLTLLITAFTLWWFSAGSRREQLILRALGASPRQLRSLWFTMGLVLILAGQILGHTCGHLLYNLISNAAGKGAGLMLLHTLSVQEIALAGGVLLCGAIISYAASGSAGNTEL